MLLEVDPQVLRARRKRLGLSQAALARRANTDRERVMWVEKPTDDNQYRCSVRTYFIINTALQNAEAEHQGDEAEVAELVAA